MAKIQPPFEPIRSSSHLNENEVSADKIMNHLRAAIFECSLDEDNDIYVTDGLEFPSWIKVDEEARAIQLFTYWVIEHGLPADPNNLNLTYRWAQFAADEKRMCASHYLTYRYGLDIRHLISVARIFASVCRKAYTETESQAAKLVS